MRLALPPSCPPQHPARLGLLFMGRARNLSQRLEALKLQAEAKVPSRQFPEAQDIDAAAPGYTPGLSRKALR